MIHTGMTHFVVIPEGTVIFNNSALQFLHIQTVQYLMSYLRPRKMIQHEM